VDGPRLRAVLRVRETPVGAAIVIACLLVVIAVARALTDEPALGISLFFVIPVLLAAFVFGRRGGVIVALVATAFFAVDEAIDPHESLEGARLVVATFTRGAVLLAVGWLVPELLHRQRKMARRLAEQELQLTQLEALQRALTPPDVPQIPRLQIATAFTPAEHDVAGDFFGVVAGPGGSTMLIIGDVVGHGPVAAQRAAFARSAMSTYANFTDDPAALLQLTNTALAERAGDDATSFVTALCARIAPDVSEFVWASAGHPGPWDLDGAGALGPGVSCPPLGVQRTLRCENSRVALGAGDGVLLFTDGLTEARRTRSAGRRERPQLGETTVRDVLRDQSGAAPAAVVAALRDAVLHHTGATLSDDLCLMAVRVDAEGGVEAQQAA
jgi:serine phosphatase RsbU (regulator of sigma subunit)